jgi:RND family efflux transporter MFP subunit
MKKLISTIFLLLTLLVTLVGCANGNENEKATERSKAVKVLKVAKAMKPITKQYIGTIDAESVIKYSFKVPGKLNRVYLKKGDKVKVGDLMAEIETKDLNFQLTAAQLTMDTAKLNIKKAEDSLRYCKDLFEKGKNLYKKGAVSKEQYDQMKLQMDIAEASHDQAKSQYDAARTDYNYKNNIITDAKLYAEQNGTVVDVIFEENERVGPHIPVVIVRSGKQVANVGIPQQDLNSVKIGAKAMIDVDGVKSEGKITYLAEAPDKSTRTYHAEVEINGKDFKLGAISKVKIDVGKENGVWIPMNTIFSNGEDYVYIIEGDRAFKRTVELVNVSDDKIMVKGIKAGELLAIKGMKNLNDGSKVSIIE